MRPARIQVFDGLRIATEHVEHLQDSLHSSIEDLREAAGLGQVIRGFAVQKDGDDAVAVGPGLAFDRHANRLALDEPQRIDVVIPAGSDVQYICIAHQSVEDGEVEGHATMVWDTVALSLEGAAPGPDSDLIAVGKVARDAGDPAAFTVEPLEPAEPGPPAPGSPDPEPSEPAPAEPAAPEPAPKLLQGVARLPLIDVPPVDALTALAAALIDLRSRNGDAEAQVSIPLGSTEVAAGLTAAGVGCTVHLSATVDRADGTAARLESAGRGEATFAADGAARFGLSEVRSLPPIGSTDPAGAWIATELIEDGVAVLPLAQAIADEPARALLSGLRLVVDVAAAAPSGVALSCALAWTGPPDEQRTQALEDQLTALSWSAGIGWKAVAA
jgi:hypothetical protein